MKRWFKKNIVPRFVDRGYICEDTFWFKNKTDNLRVSYNVRYQLGVMESQLFLSIKDGVHGWFTCNANRYNLSEPIDDFAATRDKEEYKAHISRITDQLFEYALTELEEVADSISYLEDRHYELLSCSPRWQAEKFAEGHGMEICSSPENYRRLNDWILNLRPEEKNCHKEAFEKHLTDLIPCAAFLGEMIMTKRAGEWKWVEHQISDLCERKFGVIFPTPTYYEDEDGFSPLDLIIHVWNFGGAVRDVHLSPPLNIKSSG